MHRLHIKSFQKKKWASLLFYGDTRICNDPYLAMKKNSYFVNMNFFKCYNIKFHLFLKVADMCKALTIAAAKKNCQFLKFIFLNVLKCSHALKCSHPL